MASAPPQLPPASSLSSLDPSLKSNPRFKNAWSQIVRGDPEPPPLEKHPHQHQPKTPHEHPLRQSQPHPPPQQQQQQQQPQQQQQHQHHHHQQQQLPESALQAAAMIPSASAATESASGILALSPDSPPPASPAACPPVASEKKHVGDSLPEDCESVIDKPDRSEVDASVGEIAASKAGAPETPSKVSKPAWRMPPANAGKNSEPGLVMGAVSWPALGDARSTKSSEPPLPILASAAGQRAGPKPAPASPGREGSTAQASLSEPSIHSGASGNGSDSPTGIRQRSAIKKGVTGNGMPTFWEPAPPEKVSSSVMGHSAPGSDIVPSNQFVKGGGEMGTKAVLANAGIGDQGRMYYQRSEGGVSFPNFAGNRRHNMRDQGRGNQGWHPPNRGYVNGRDYGLALQQQRIGPRNLPRPAHPFMSASPGFINAAGFPSGMYYMPAPVPDPLLGAAYFVPPATPGVLMHGPDPMTLRVMLVKQIEYYFSVENLCRDVYLRTNMDKQGFVPISVIANFNRVRMLTPNPHLILDSLRKSTVVEVQGERIRKRDDWAKWILPPSQYDSINSSQEDKKERALNILQEDWKESAKSHIPVKKDEDSKARPDRANDLHDDAAITSSISLPQEQAVPLPQEQPGLHFSEKSDGFGVLQSSYGSGDAHLQSCVTEVKGSDGEANTGRTTGSERNLRATSSSLQSDVDATVRHGCVGDWGNGLPSDDARAFEGSKRVSHLMLGNVRKEDSSALMEGITFAQVEELESDCLSIRDPGCQTESCSSEDEKDSKVTEDLQRLGIVAQTAN